MHVYQKKNRAYTFVFYMAVLDSYVCEHSIYVAYSIYIHMYVLYYVYVCVCIYTSFYCFSRTCLCGGGVQPVLV